MRKSTIGFGLMVVAALFVLLSGCMHEQKEAKDQKIATGEVPQNVMASVQHRLPGAQVTGVEKENEAGGIVYDFELTQQGRKYEMDVKEDGTIMEIEKQVSANDAPPAVMKAVQGKWPTATVKEIMEVDVVKGAQETADHYEVTLATADAKEKEVVVSMDGAIKEEGGEENK
jgi:uncharacterized membrane protein YkoI